jgi:hypothetical protein
MSGYADFNFPAFENAAKALRAHGMRVLSAHEIKHDEPVHGAGTLPIESYYRTDLLAFLKECDGIVLLPGWHLSTGARIEFDVALALKMAVYFYVPPGPDGEGRAIICMRTGRRQ